MVRRHFNPVRTARKFSRKWIKSGSVRSTYGRWIEVVPSRFNECCGRCRVELCFPPRLAKFAMAAACAGWSNDETKALLGIWGASEVQSQLDGVVRNCTIYEKVVAQLREAR